MESIAKLATEQTNAQSDTLDRMSALEIVQLMNGEDRTVAEAVAQEVPRIAAAVDQIADRLRRGGRLLYLGAGTSGRLGVLDASECPPTFGIEADLVVGVVAGGPDAVVEAREGAEDDSDAGATDLQSHRLTAADIVVGLSASGRTPYVAGGLRYAKQVGAGTVALSCNQGAEISALAEVAIEVSTGPEVLMGSTRLKAGTAQKMVLNMLSTAVMVRLGKAYGNLMIDVKPTNVKLVDRACRMLMTAAGVEYETASAALQASGRRAKVALVMLKTSCSVDEAERRLQAADGFARAAIEEGSHDA
ncbi:N-acetylmuramic acid 6-phosphate etherase [Tumebacillus permanentifrigoris]|uniref:N-acetylmuramic acid 6-phosphate etherase n=1 Tax=Tumebacillus permanentifrigoris TaxID=378543 RepID=A0A316DD62_9BACL|nr:N-acetylmuramic acid 6-phosphate etherase [Tumebacillus permanentifrigoris]PWK15626.1 N-acetylmuramic acid 6-phosphate etherase [Tumebacillus permanentifrigoris]